MTRIAILASAMMAYRLNTTYKGFNETCWAARRKN